MNAGVIGAGSWGSAIAIAIAKTYPVKLWSHNHLQVEQLQHGRNNPNYLSSNILFPQNVDFISDLSLLAGSELLIIATPVNALREILRSLKEVLGDQLPAIIWLCKGFESNSGLLPHQVFYEVLGDDCCNFGALLGPSFAHEVAIGLPVALTFASPNLDFALSMAKFLCSIPNFRVYAHDDLIGSEVSAGVKNIMAIAVGISDGLKFGLNARAALITRSLSEISKLILMLGGKPNTAYGLSGVGDLILTCTGDLSRNRTVGLRLAAGVTLQDILESLGHVAEGVYATKEVYFLAKQLDIDMPIVNAVYDVVFNSCDIKQTVSQLINRDFKCEFDLNEDL